MNKNIQSFVVALILFSTLSCVNHDVAPTPDNYIKAKVGDNSMAYSDLVPEQQIVTPNYRYAQFSFREQTGNCRTWSMMIMNVDLKNASFPLTIGPITVSGSDPEFSMSIIDQCVGFYGTAIGQLTNFQSESKLTIMSFKDGVMTGEFSGVSFSKPISGSFRVKLAVRDL
jgi:hypothetical protein